MILFHMQHPLLELASKIQTRFLKISDFLRSTRFAKPLPYPFEASTFADNLLKFRSNYIFLDTSIHGPLPLLIKWILKDKNVYTCFQSIIGKIFTPIGIYGQSTAPIL